MLTVSFTQLRNNAKKYFDAVERGETVEVYRHGKPVALLSPVGARGSDRWKTANPLRLNGVRASRLIIAERRSGR